MAAARHDVIVPKAPLIIVQDDRKSRRACTWRAPDRARSGASQPESVAIRESVRLGKATLSSGNYVINGDREPIRVHRWLTVARCTSMPVFTMLNGAVRANGCRRAPEKTWLRRSVPAHESCLRRCAVPWRCRQVLQAIWSNHFPHARARCACGPWNV